MKVKHWAIAAAAYAALTIALTWPLVLHLSTVLPHDLGDPVLNTWILWWNAHTVPLTARWWNAPIFWPAPGALAFSEHLLGLTPITSAVQWLGGSPVTAYNVLFLLTFPLSALAAHALGFSLTRRHDAAVVAGLAYGFNPYRIAQLPHVQVLASFGMPLCLFALHQYVQRRDRRWLWLFGAAWLQQALANGYFMVFFPVLLAMWVAWFLRGDRRAQFAVAATFVVATLPSLPILWGYRQVHHAFNMRRGFGEIVDFSADLAGFVDASPLVAWWGRFQSFHTPEGELYPGFAICLLIAVVAVMRGRAVARGARSGSRRLQAAFAIGSLVCTAIALSALAFGPWAITIGSTKLLTVGVANKPLTLAILFAIAALAFTDRVVFAASTKSAFAFYVVAAVALYGLSLGPLPRFLGAPFMYRAPYAWLMMIPGFDTMRVPARFAMVALVCLSAAAAIAFAWATESLTRRNRTIAATMIVAAILAESWMSALPLLPLPARLGALEHDTRAAAVLELPLGLDVERDTASMYRSMYHGHPVINGYSGFGPPANLFATYGLEADDDAVLDAMAGDGPLLIAADDSHVNGHAWAERLTRRPDVTYLGAEAGHRIFSMPAKPRPAVESGGTKLHIGAITTSGPPALPGALTDGDSMTRWTSTGLQFGVEWVIADLGSVQTVSRIVLLAGTSTVEFPRDLSIETSNDGTAWTSVWRGRTASRLYDSALTDTHDVPMSISFAPARARYIRLRQLGRDRRFRWSIGDLSVFGP